MVTKQTETKKPLASGNSYGVSTAIWENQNDAGTKYKTISINVSQKDKENEGQYKKRTILFASDLDNLITSLTELKTNAKANGLKTGYEKR